MRPEQPIPIQIDQKPFKATTNAMTGAELRALPTPPIGADRHLWQVVAGPEDDIRINDADPVMLKPGMHFYSSPTSINPGGSHASA